MINLEWLKNVKKEDVRYYSQETDIKKYSDSYRQIKALEIIAEELCYIREKINGSSVVNSINYPKHKPLSFPKYKEKDDIWRNDSLYKKYKSKKRA